MNLSLSSLFKKKSTPSQSLLLKKIKALCKTDQFYTFEDITIYNKNKNIFLDLILLDPKRGLYIFENKTWAYEDLKNAKAVQSTNQYSKENNLSFKTTHNFIKEKFNDIIHNDGVEIFNFLLLDNLKSDEYEGLNSSLKKLLPKEQIIFSDTSQDLILEKLKNITKENDSNLANVAANLFSQYIVLGNDNTTYMATRDQIEFINSKLKEHIAVSGDSYSGKSTSIILKAIAEKQKNPKIKITIIEPTKLASDILKNELLKSLEYTMTDIDVSEIEILTPIELVNKHLLKLNLLELDDTLLIPDAIMHKPFSTADLIICDDADLISDEFIQYLRYIQESKSLIVVTQNSILEKRYLLNRRFSDYKPDVQFERTNQHAKAMHIISNLLKTQKPEDILVISSNLNRDKLNEDLKNFIRYKAVLLDSSNNLVDQSFDGILLSTYEQTASIRSKFVIILDVEKTSLPKLYYASDRCDKTLFVLYEEESQNINSLRKRFESY